MRRYIDFRGDEWAERTDSRMQAARWAACIEGLEQEPPQAGVIDTYPDDLLRMLVAEGWADLTRMPDGEDDLRAAVRRAVMDTLSMDADCLSIAEHTLVERMLIGDGRVVLESVADMEAAYTLRMRLWCDVGVEDDEAVARMDEQLLQALPEWLMTGVHQERRGRIFIFSGMLEGMLYIAGWLDDRLPKERFIQDVLQAKASPETERLARNYLEASYDTYEMGGCNLLLHEALAVPEQFAGKTSVMEAPQLPPLSPGLMAASMNGLLPEESIPNEKLRRALHGALRPEYDPEDASTDLRFLAKQNAPAETLQEIMASMLVVLPTPHMDAALHELRLQTPRWHGTDGYCPPQGSQGAAGVLH